MSDIAIQQREPDDMMQEAPNLLRLADQVADVDFDDDMKQEDLIRLADIQGVADVVASCLPVNDLLCLGAAHRRWRHAQLDAMSRWAGKSGRMRSVELRGVTASSADWPAGRAATVLVDGESCDGGDSCDGGGGGGSGHRSTAADSPTPLLCPLIPWA